MEVSKKDEELLLNHQRNHQMSLKEIILVLHGMASEADGLECAALTQAVDHLKRLERIEAIKKREG